MSKRTAAVTALLAALAALTGCGEVEGASGEGGGATLTVFAAASLTETFTRLGETFEKTHPGTDVRFGFAGSSTLARQIAHGAPADVFASASHATMKTVTDAGDAAGGPRVFATNRLVIAVPEDNPGGVRSVGDLAGDGLRVVLCAEQVPCGAAARTALDAAGVTVEAASREKDVKAVLTKVRLGEADAGLVYRTDARAAGGDVTGIEFAAAAGAVNEYPIVQVADAPQPGLAREFIALVTGPRGRAVLGEAGFGAP
ncbi:molybdate ABC transporter substrate-binding protein [Actinomadura sediminis]|uniref:Molybdate ABC transporter substrate-binding protein n=1 Tax=Actinomadura sediminis TaxID=1038904 RepID=A0ABW3ERU3_9ACTN